MSKWFEVKCRFVEEQENGIIMSVTKSYVVSADSFSESEAMAHEFVGANKRGEFFVKEVKTLLLHDIYLYDDASTWWQAKVEYMVDNDFGKSVPVINNFLVTASNIDQASTRICDCLQDDLMNNFEVIEIKKTRFMEVFVKKIEEPAKEKTKIKNSDEEE